MSANLQRTFSDSLPVLTEVVFPLPQEPRKAALELNQEEWVGHIMAQLEPLLTAQLREKVVALVQAQMQTLEVQLRQDAETVVRQALEQLVSAANNPDQVKQ